MNIFMLFFQGYFDDFFILFPVQLKEGEKDIDKFVPCGLCLT